MFSGKCTSAARLDGKTAIVTGSNTGIGKVTAKEFYRIGMDILCCARWSSHLSTDRNNNIIVLIMVNRQSRYL